MKLLTINCLTVLLLFLNVSCIKDKPFYPGERKPDIEETNDEDYTDLTQKLINTKKVISKVIKDTTFQVTEGVEATEIRYTNLEDKSMQLFILAIDLKLGNLTLKVATPFDQTAFTTQTVLDMAEMINTSENVVIGGINGDFYNISTLIPRGIVHKNGDIIKDTFSDNTDAPQQGLSFFGVLDDGKPYIGDKSEYEAMAGRLNEALGGGIVFLKDKNIITQSITNIDPRTAIGYTEDDIVYFLVADGRNPIYSNGLTYAELSIIMKAFDVKDAVNLDGGGSSTFMIKNPISKSLEVRNQPSDGADRAVANAWLVISSKNQ
ncbi:phosphodiester glycosidase family protein [Sphingobacterium sp. SGG-5]|uniref:phosphodiester glycosidase family protein n=1 Tax=Sphingobacterium sp. SGG-5 TaxID=2710881 RepID=UPI0013E9E024|nr:phosphodiester glycosidase family protein [Sphingobacterium sp. SGG-5]NGM60825.1 phosphodiester glycosidase family protein [Sphingobacterium sp. SGG-5]